MTPGSDLCGIGLQVSSLLHLLWRQVQSLTEVDAERAADDGGMTLVNMDLSYMGIYSIWTNDLGKYCLLPST